MNHTVKTYITFFALLFLAFFQVGHVSFSLAQSAADSEKVQDTQDDIKKIEKQLNRVQSQIPTLQKNLESIQTSIGATQRNINATQSFIDQTNETIRRKTREIEELTQRLEFQKTLLAGLVQSLYYYYQSQASLSRTIFLPNEESGMFSEGDSVLSLEERINTLVDDVRSASDSISDEKENLELVKSEKENLLEIHHVQKQDLLEDKGEMQSEINQKQATVAELQGKLSKLKGELSDLLGKSYDAKDIRDAASFAAKVTGVRKDFLMGMLVVESDLGRYTGGCDYKQSRMSGYRLDVFKQIAKELEYDYKKLKVSCPPKSYSGTGGAMGVAQFMPDTWMGYKSSIASSTGHKPPDPWNLTDGVTAMALKLGKVSGVTDHKKSGECNAAKLYLSGTTSSKYQWYCDRVLYWADNYEKKL